MRTEKPFYGSWNFRLGSQSERRGLLGRGVLGGGGSGFGFTGRPSARGLAQRLLAGGVHAPGQPGLEPLRGSVAVAGAGPEVVQRLGVGIEAGQLQLAEHREEQPSQPGSVLAAGAEARPRHDRPRLQPLLPAGPRPAARIPAPHRPVDLRAVAQHRARPLHGLSEEEWGGYEVVDT